MAVTLPITGPRFSPVISEPPIVHASTADLAEAAADLLAAELATTPRLGLAGGSTPEATYRRLAGRPVDWDRVDLWLGDERWVPPGHGHSNATMARSALGPTAGRRLITPPWAPGLTPHQAATAYQHALADRFGGERLEPGILLLGIGDDAHTASLFPGTRALDADEDYVATFVPQHAAWRLTATFPTIHRADLVVFLVAGAGKADAVHELIHGDGTAPCTRVASGPQRTVILLDEAAAARLGPDEVVRR